MSDIEDRITALINADPLPEDAEQQLDALIAQLPPEDRRAAEATWPEALFMARQSPDQPSIDF